jgi:histidine ammonia-lyase
MSGRCICSSGSAERLRRLLKSSTFWRRGRADRIQNPLSLRCVPQVHGACQDALAFVRGTMEIELNGSGDNPVVLTDANAIVSNGNFHSAGLAIAFDTLGIVLGQLSGLATSRVLRVLDPHLTDLPPALVRRAGVNTGFNVLQKTLTALNAENRYLAAPASLDFQPLAGEIEDHATNAALCVRKPHRSWRIASSYRRSKSWSRRRRSRCTSSRSSAKGRKPRSRSSGKWCRPLMRTAFWRRCSTR